MNYVDISKDQKNKYKEIIKIIINHCDTFKIVDSYGDLDIKELEFYSDFIEMKRSNKWAGTISRGAKAYIYSFKISKNTKRFLNKFDSFFYYDDDGCYLDSFLNEQYDYSFHKNDDCILYATSHEGLLYIRNDMSGKCLSHIN